MRRERSQGKCAQSDAGPATLFVVGVPIGHPDDLTVRAISTLRQVDLIAAKNTQSTQTLLSHHGIHAVVTTYDRENAAEKVPVLLDRLRQGHRIALVSDCGMPAIYDPGRLLISAASKEHIPIEVIPGASAVVAAVALCGLDGDAFLFEGRWSGGLRQITRRLQAMRSEPRTMIFLPPAQTLPRLLPLILTTFGNRRLVVALDITKATQKIVRGRVRTVLAKNDFRDPALQVTLIVEGLKGRGK
jgi:16S rRNA (cytidine1402-2'-O)-methyltransferase